MIQCLVLVALAVSGAVAQASHPNLRYVRHAGQEGVRGPPPQQVQQQFGPPPHHHPDYMMGNPQFGQQGQHPNQPQPGSQGSPHQGIPHQGFPMLPPYGMMGPPPPQPDQRQAGRDDSQHDGGQYSHPPPYGPHGFYPHFMPPPPPPRGAWPPHRDEDLDQDPNLGGKLPPQAHPRQRRYSQHWSSPLETPVI